MDDDTEVLPPENLIHLLTEQADEDAIEYVDTLQTAPTEDRKAALRALRRFADERPRSLEPVLDALTPFLTDEERAVRLTTAKLFVAVAEATPAAVVPVMDSLAARLADEDEFYYVRARSAEALGYVALDHPEEVASPETLADLRIGLAFDEPEVKEKLAKALAFVALGNPDRLRHQVTNLADDLDDEQELVRYHLTTALVVVGCEYPGKLTDARAALADRVSDGEENPYVRGRTAEALGLLARADTDDRPLIEAYRREEEGIWEESASYTDWVVQQGRYEGEEWLDTATGWHLDAAPDDLDEEVAREQARELAEEQQNQQVDAAEVERRTERAHRQLLDHIDDDVIRAYVEGGDES